MAEGWVELGDGVSALLWNGAVALYEDQEGRRRPIRMYGGRVLLTERAARRLGELIEEWFPYKPSSWSCPACKCTISGWSTPMPPCPVCKWTAPPRDCFCEECRTGGDGHLY